MPLDPLQKSIESFGYVVTDVIAADESTYGNISGGLLKEAIAILRANKDTCLVGVLLGAVDGVHEKDRYALAIEFLELNFANPFAHIGILRVPAEKGKTPVVEILLAETAMFKEGLSKARFDRRIEALVSAAETASSYLAARQALVNTNPFFERLRVKPPPIGRGDFPDKTE